MTDFVSSFKGHSATKNPEKIKSNSASSLVNALKSYMLILLICLYASANTRDPSLTCFKYYYS